MSFTNLYCHIVLSPPSKNLARRDIVADGGRVCNTIAHMPAIRMSKNGVYDDIQYLLLSKMHE